MLLLVEQCLNASIQPAILLLFPLFGIIDLVNLARGSISFYMLGA
jgi:hypothetical protein